MTEDRGQMSKVKIYAECDKCGPFAVERKRRPVKLTSGQVVSLPQNVVCPTCRMWGTIIAIEEIAK